jgi:hypothetical protein
MAQAGSTHTRAACHRQGVCSRWCSRVAGHISAYPASAAAGHRQDQQQSGRERDERSADSAELRLFPAPDYPSHSGKEDSKNERPCWPR